MTEEKKPEEMIIDESLQQAVEKAMELPVPEQAPKEEKKPYLFEQVAWDFRKGLQKNKFRVGSKEKKLEVKLDADGNPIKHGNGFVMVKSEKKS